jgi:RimJ/RimL family protein N-acetyltransferase
VAQQLLGACDVIVRNWGKPQLYLHVASANHQAQQLYRKLGYQLHHPTPWWDQASERMLMCKRLNP